MNAGLSAGRGNHKRGTALGVGSDNIENGPARAFGYTTLPKLLSAIEGSVKHYFKHRSEGVLRKILGRGEKVSGSIIYQARHLASARIEVGKHPVYRISISNVARVCLKMERLRTSFGSCLRERLRLPPAYDNLCTVPSEGARHI
jgi:hypothetical protein